MKNKLSAMILAALIAISFSFQVHAQEKIEGLSFSVAIEKTNLRASRRPKVKITIENKTGGTIYFGNQASIELKLDKSGRSNFGCTSSNCLSAFAPFKDKLIENNKSIEAEFELTDLYWMDAISSSINSKKPKNLFKTITSGSYLFYASLNVSPNAQTLDLSDFISLESNAITVSV